MAHLNPNIRKCARGEGGAGSQPPGSEAFFGNTFRHATGPGSSAHFTPDPLSSCHKTCFHLMHETSSIGSTVPLLCPD